MSKNFQGAFWANASQLAESSKVPDPRAGWYVDLVQEESGTYWLKVYKPSPVGSDYLVASTVSGKWTGRIMAKHYLRKIKKVKGQSEADVMKDIQVFTGPKGQPFLWAVTEQDLRISGHWTNRGLFITKADAKRHANELVKTTSIWTASLSEWRNYGAGLDNVDEIRWWDGEHLVSRLEGELFAERSVEHAYSGRDWNDSAFTQLIEKRYITEHVHAYGEWSEGYDGSQVKVCDCGARIYD